MVVAELAIPDWRLVADDTLAATVVVIAEPGIQWDEHDLQGMTFQLVEHELEVVGHFNPTAMLGGLGISIPIGFHRCRTCG